MDISYHLFLTPITQSQENIEEHEREIEGIDMKLSQHGEAIRQLVKTQDGQKLVELSLPLIHDAPWFMKTISLWTLEQVASLKEQTEALVQEDDDAIKELTGYVLPLSDALVSCVACKAGSSFSVVTNAAKMAIAHLPLIGPLSGIQQRRSDLNESVNQLMLNGRSPQRKTEWEVVLRALKRVQLVHKFELDVWAVHKQNDGWPRRDFLTNPGELRDLNKMMNTALQLKQIARNLKVEENIRLAVECRSLDTRRSILAAKLQNLAEEIVDATVVAELSCSFSTKAQSALIRFAQLAGKQKFNRGSQLSKMTQRQKRRRQDYLDAFDRCCRFIPCWIMTTSQISDYLPAECLFDLVIIDENSSARNASRSTMVRSATFAPPLYTTPI
jgi:methylglyoxal synthase